MCTKQRERLGALFKSYVQLAVAWYRSDSDLLWYGRFSLRERFTKSRSWQTLYATSVRLDDQCVWARAIDVSWTPAALDGRGVLLARASTTDASPREALGSARTPSSSLSTRNFALLSLM